MNNPNTVPKPGPLNVSDELVKSRILWLNEDVNDQNMADLSQKIMYLSAVDPEKDIYLFINSPGGSITSGLMLYDIITLIPNDVVTVGVGMCASMGQFLLTIGAPGKRFMTQNARVLLHQPLGGFGGTVSSIITQSDLINTMKTQLAGLTASRTGKTVEQVMADGDRDRWFMADEALEYGFVDHIITHVNDITRLAQERTK